MLQCCLRAISRHTSLSLSCRTRWRMVIRLRLIRPPDIDPRLQTTCINGITTFLWLLQGLKTYDSSEAVPKHLQCMSHYAWQPARIPSYVCGHWPHINASSHLRSSLTASNSVSVFRESIPLTLHAVAAPRNSPKRTTCPVATWAISVCQSEFVGFGGFTNLGRSVRERFGASSNPTVMSCVKMEIRR